MGYRSAGKLSMPPFPPYECIVTDVALWSVVGFRVDVLPSSRLSPRSTRGRRMMGLRGAGLPMFVARSSVHIFIDFGQLCSSKPATNVHGNRTAVFMISA